jgi:hypothetical protein
MYVFFKSVLSSGLNCSLLHHKLFCMYIYFLLSQIWYPMQYMICLILVRVYFVLSWHFCLDFIHLYYVRVWWYKLNVRVAFV